MSSLFGLVPLLSPTPQSPTSLPPESASRCPRVFLLYHLEGRFPTVLRVKAQLPSMTHEGLHNTLPV